MAEDIIEQVRIAKGEKEERMEKEKGERVELAIVTLEGLGFDREGLSMDERGRVRYPGVSGGFVYADDGQLRQVFDDIFSIGAREVDCLADIELVENPDGLEGPGPELLVSIKAWRLVGESNASRGMRSAPWPLRSVYIAEARDDGSTMVHCISPRKARDLWEVGQPIKLRKGRVEVWVCNLFEHPEDRDGKGRVVFPEKPSEANILD